MSFSKKVKSQLIEFSGKVRNCCIYSFIYGLLYAKNNDDIICVKAQESVGIAFLKLVSQLNLKKDFCPQYDGKKISINKEFMRYKGFEEIKENVIKCPKCIEYFLRGVFLSIGTVTDPEKSYRLELVFNSIDELNGIKGCLDDMGIACLVANRSGKYVLYLRKSESIEDFFANIGATSLAFDFMNSKINKELINNANRVTNCDSANINKAIKASNKYNSVIIELINTNNIDKLPDALQEMAKKRIEYKEMSFSELGKQFSPSISKSGVHHRLEKILDFYNELKEKNLL